MVPALSTSMIALSKALLLLNKILACGMNIGSAGYG